MRQRWQHSFAFVFLGFLYFFQLSFALQPKDVLLPSLRRFQDFTVDDREALQQLCQQISSVVLLNFEKHSQFELHEKISFVNRFLSNFDQEIKAAAFLKTRSFKKKKKQFVAPLTYAFCIGILLGKFTLGGLNKKLEVHREKNHKLFTELIHAQSQQVCKIFSEQSQQNFVLAESLARNNLRLCCESERAAMKTDFLQKMFVRRVQNQQNVLQELSVVQERNAIAFAQATVGKEWVESVIGNVTMDTQILKSQLHALARKISSGEGVALEEVAKINTKLYEALERTGKLEEDLRQSQTKFADTVSGVVKQLNELKSIVEESLESGGPSLGVSFDFGELLQLGSATGQSEPLSGKRKLSLEKGRQVRQSTFSSNA